MLKIKKIWNILVKIVGTLDLIFILGLSLFMVVLGFWDKIKNKND